VPRGVGLNLTAGSWRQGGSASFRRRHAHCIPLRAYFHHLLCPAVGHGELDTVTCETTAVPVRHTIVPVRETEKLAVRKPAEDATWLLEQFGISQEFPRFQV
jgi:hypothetical protein